MSEQQMTVTEENPEHEVVLGESVSEDERRIRVYMPGGEDFVIDVPAKAKVTFGYFNPAVAGSSQPNDYGRHHNVSKETSLRIYEAGEKGNQLACFIGVTGFRDYRVKKTKLVQKVMVERRYADDGEGNEDWSGKSQRELVVSSEDDSIPF
jgi:hypothetical protein